VLEDARQVQGRCMMHDSPAVKSSNTYRTIRQTIDHPIERIENSIDQSTIQSNNRRPNRTIINRVPDPASRIPHPGSRIPARERAASREMRDARREARGASYQSL
jgi:hypothetical protein